MSRVWMPLCAGDFRGERGGRGDQVWRLHWKGSSKMREARKGVGGVAYEMMTEAAPRSWNMPSGNVGACVWSAEPPPRHAACHSRVATVSMGKGLRSGRGRRPLQGCHSPQQIRSAWGGGNVAAVPCDWLVKSCQKRNGTIPDPQPGPIEGRGRSVDQQGSSRMPMFSEEPIASPEIGPGGGVGPCER